SGNDTLIVSDEFSVLPTEKDSNGNDISLFILGTRWQHRAGWEPIVKGKFTASANGKNITIPLSVYNESETLNKNCKKVDKQISLTSNRVSPTSNQVSPTSNRVSPTSDQ
ncbi:14766_t:CDS:2, partial [Racocetra fulgida]